MKKSVSSLLAAALVLGVHFSADAKKPGDPETQSKAVSQKLVDALAGELERNMAMRIPGAPRPYFISYKLTEVEVYDATATLGSLTASSERHFVSLEAHVHVGSYQKDNTNFILPQREGTDGIASAQLPLEATPKTATKLAWLATDQAYKEAVQQYEAKQDALRSGATGSDAASYTKAPPLAKDKIVLVPNLETLATVQSRAKRVSANFRGKKVVRDSRVSFTSFLERRWYLNSEGTSSHDTRRVSGVLISASGQAKDGQDLNTYFTKYGHTAADLPSDKALAAETARLTKTLGKLATAPVIESYTGPVLFAGEGAVGIVRNTLSPHLSGTPIPVGASAQASVFGGGLITRLGRRIAAANINISDDPTARRLGKQPLIGGYRFDDEGVRPKRIEIVKKGMLTDLPMSRTPTKVAKNSNGHARRSVAGGLFRGSPTNLIVSATGGKSRGQLIKLMLKTVKKEGLPYGLIVEQFDDYAITANNELSRVELFQLLQSVDPNAPPPATVALKVFPNGKTEYVRGVQLKRFDVDKWRQVAAVGRKPRTRNFLDSTENQALAQMRGQGDGFVPSAGVESSITVADILFPEVTVERNTPDGDPRLLSRAELVARPGGKPQEKSSSGFNPACLASRALPVS